MKFPLSDLLRKRRKTAVHRLKVFIEPPPCYDNILVNIPTDWDGIDGFPGVWLKAEDQSDMDLTLIWCRFDTEAVFPEHYHISYEEVITVMQGRMSATLDGEHMDLRPGQGFVAEAHQIHGFQALEPTLLALTFSPALIRTSSGDEE